MVLTFVSTLMEINLLRPGLPLITLTFTNKPGQVKQT